VDDRREELTSNLVHVGYKEQQSLRSCKGGCQGSRVEGSMQGSS
jgi:hypothetical protein